MSSGGRPFSFLVSSRVKRMPCVQCECVLIRVQVSPERYSTTVNISYLDLYESSLYSLYSPVRGSRDTARLRLRAHPPRRAPQSAVRFFNFGNVYTGRFFGLRSCAWGDTGFSR